MTANELTTVAHLQTLLIELNLMVAHEIFTVLVFGLQPDRTFSKV